MSILSQKKLYIPFESFNAIGGPSTFMSNFKKFLNDAHMEYCSRYNDSCGIFFPIQFDIEVLRKIKNNNGKIIQRLDGIYYPAKHGDQFVDLNCEIKNIYQNFADHIIFQSNYSKAQCFEMFGIISDNDYSIILNGVHKDIFFPELNHKVGDEWNLVTTGNFRNIDMIEPLISACDLLKHKYKIRLHIVGPIVNKSLEKFIAKEYVLYYGVKSIHQLAEILRKMDIFVYSHLNPPCPNSVLEAISTGLPVVGFDSGAMKELCWFSTNLLVYVSVDTFQRYEDFNHEKLAEKIESCFCNFQNYKKISLANSNLYSFAECGQRYLDVFDKVLLQ
jgi:glycosyltransferase involved in cell wall biosynthesis